MTDQLDLDGLDTGEAFCPAFYQAHIDEAWRCLRDGKPYTVNADGALAILNRALDDRSAVKSLITRLRAAEAATAAAVGWQDISTAPKGPDILAYVPGLGMGQMVLFWMDGYWREKANMLGLKTPPTHWMPLPSTPVAENA